MDPEGAFDGAASEAAPVARLVAQFDAVVRALTDEAYRQLLAETGYAVIDRHYTPDQVYGELARAIDPTVELDTKPQLLQSN